MRFFDALLFVRFFTALLIAGILVGAPALPVRAGAASDLAAADRALSSHRFSRAAGIYTRAIKSGRLNNAQLYDAYYSLGLAHKAMGRLGLALLDFSQVLRLHPRHAGAYLRRGQIYQSRYFYHQAVDDYDQAVRINPYSYYARLLRGRALVAMGKYHAALKDYRRICRLLYRSPLGWTEKALLYEKLGNYSEALVNIRKAYDLGPSKRLRRHLQRISNKVFADSFLPNAMTLSGVGAAGRKRTRSN